MYTDSNKYTTNVVLYHEKISTFIPSSSVLRLTKVRVAGCGLRATDCGLRVAGHRLRAEGMRAAGHRLPAMGHRLRLRAKCGVRVKYFDPSLCD